MVCPCVCAGDALASEDSIHMVPFQFDLIQLLPKCQQVELFFLTFSTGTVTIQLICTMCLNNDNSTVFSAL